MASTLIQFRADDTEKIEATKICDGIGINLQTYFKICLSRLIAEKGIPFSMKLADVDDSDRALRALKRASRIAEGNGIADMSLEEINAEIAAVRNKN